MTNHDMRKATFSLTRAEVPTTQFPGGSIEAEVKTQPDGVRLICHDNKTIAAWACDLTPQMAEALGTALIRLAVLSAAGVDE